MANKARLTEKHFNGKGYYLICSGVVRCDNKCDDCEELSKAIDRLGEYEDKAEQTVEVVHGRWEKCEPDKHGNKKPKCSVCGQYHLAWWSDYTHCNYCPNCGAKMDGGTQHD